MKVPGMFLRGSRYWLRVVAPLELQARFYRGKRIAYEESLGTSDPQVARVLATAKRGELEAQFLRQKQQLRPQAQNALAPTAALVDLLLTKLRSELLADDDLNRMAGHPLAHLLVPAELQEMPTDPLERWEHVASVAQSLAEAMGALMAMGQDDLFVALLAHTLTDTGLPEVDWDAASPALWQRWCRGVVTLHQDIAARARGEVVETPEPPVIQANPAADELSLQTLRDDWVAAKTRTVPATKITDRAIREFKEKVGDIPVGKLERVHAAQFRAALVATGLKGQSVKNLIGPLQALLNLAVDSGKLKTNPWLGVKVDTSDSVDKLPWTTEDLKKLVAQNAKRDYQDAGRWLLPILLHTGCRSGEAAQLELADIKQVDGVWCFDFHDRKTEGHEKRTIKTKAGVRVTPIHQRLIDTGFLVYVEERREAGDRFLFPKFIQKGKRRPSELAGRDFLALRDGAGLQRDERYSAHSTRHNVKSAMVAANINDILMNLTIGHESGTVQQRYSHAQMPGLVRAIQALDWSHAGL